MKSTILVTLSLLTLYANAQQPAHQVTIPIVTASASLDPAECKVRGKGVSLVAVERVEPLRLPQAPLGKPGEARPIFVVLDTIAIVPPDRGTWQQDFLEYLRQLAGAPELVTILAMERDRTMLLHAMNTDPGVLAGALNLYWQDRKKGTAKLEVRFSQPDSGKREASIQLAAQRIRQFIANAGLKGDQEAYGKAVRRLGQLEQLGSALGQMPGQKDVLWITTDFPVQLDSNQLALLEVLPGATQAYGGPTTAFSQAWQRAVNALVEANVRVYALQVTGNNQGSPFQIRTTREGLDLFTSATGGQVLSPADHVSDAVRQLETHNQRYYRATLRTELQQDEVTWTKLSVECGGQASVRGPAGMFFVTR